MKNDVKKIILILLTAVLVLSLAGCFNDLGSHVIFMSDGKIWQTNICIDPMNAKPIGNPEKKDHTFKEWRFVEILDDGTYVFEAVWEHDIIKYTVTIELLGEIKTYSVTYNTVFTPETITNDYYDIKGYVDAVTGKAFDFSKPITGDVKVKAVTEFNVQRSVQNFKNSISAAFNEKFGTDPLYSYSAQDYEKALALLNQAKDELKTQTTYEAMLAVEKAYNNEISNIKTFSERLQAYYASLDMTAYYSEQQQELSEIYENAIYALDAYNGGAPSPISIYDNAIQALSQVNTIEKDNEIAQESKSAFARRLSAYAASVKTEENAAEIQAALADGLQAIDSAVGTKALSKAYADAIGRIKAIIA